jgi:exodeoxyribonuclease V alpha subunit
MDKTTLEGVLERIIFFNEDNNFTVARLQSGQSRDLVTIVGNLPGPNPGETLRLSGEWTNDAKLAGTWWQAAFLSYLLLTDC